MHWDLFISHASEDKEEFVRELADRLTEKGLDVWYDEFTLKMGDSLRRSIDKGLAESDFGVIVLSSDFFKKEWPQKELDGLVARETVDTKVILPIWHKVSKDDVMKFSPTLADRKAACSEEGMDKVIEYILKVVKPELIEEVGAVSPQKSERVRTNDSVKWLGTPWKGRFLAWYGPYERLELKENRYYEESMRVALNAAGFKERLCAPEKLSEHSKKGYNTIYLTDKNSWRQKIIQGRLILMAKPIDS